jgi:hypothetical protein
MDTKQIEQHTALSHDALLLSLENPQLRLSILSS